MLDDAADIVERHFGKPPVTVAGEQVLSILHQRLVNMGAVTIVIHQRLGHEGGGLAVTVGHVHERILENLHRVGPC